MKVQLRPSESRATAGNKFRLRMDLFLNRPAGIPASFAPPRALCKNVCNYGQTSAGHSRRLIADGRELTAARNLNDEHFITVLTIIRISFCSSCQLYEIRLKVII